MKNRFIGDRAFYKTVMTVALPIILQNLITNFVILLDNFMVGRLGTEQMSGVSIANQIMLVVNLALFGALNGIGIYGAQFYGKGNTDGIRCSLRFKFYVGTAISAVAAAILFFFKDGLIGLFLHDENASSAGQTLEFAAIYIVVMLAGLLPYALSQAFATTLRETGDTFMPMIASFAAVAINAVGNFVLIFGKFCAPKLGVTGAAIATVVSRFAELFILLIYSCAKKDRFPYIRGLMKTLKIPREYLGGFFAKGLSLMGNEILWSGSQTAMSIAYSLHGLDVVAAYSISSTVINLFFIFCMSIGVAAGIIIGNELGAGEHEKAILYSGRLIFFSLASCVVISTFMAIFGGKIPELYNTSDASKVLAAYFIRVSSLFMPADAFCNNAYFTLRSGGKTLMTMVFDSGSLWLLSVPTAFLLFYVGHLGITTVYPIVVSLQLVKALVGFFLLKSKIWVNTIV